jgi:hypothetical protein
MLLIIVLIYLSLAFTSLYVLHLEKNDFAQLCPQKI